MHAQKPKDTPQIIPAELLLAAYRSGIFPMADGREEDEVYWVEPRERAVIPLETFRPSHSLARTGDYRLLDCQFMTEHLATLGAVSISREAYLEQLAEAARAGPAPPLPELYASFCAGAGSAGDGVGEGGAGPAGAAAGSSPSPEETAGPSPGKLILQSLTQTS